MGEPADPRDRFDERLEFLAAMQELGRLPERMQRVVIVRSQVYRQADVAELLGVSTARVGHLLQSVSTKLRELTERRTEAERPVASPRAARLRELEDEPPKWLTEAIGRVPARSKSASSAVLAWPVPRSRSTTTGATMVGARATSRLDRNRRCPPPAGLTTALSAQSTSCAPSGFVSEDCNANGEMRRAAMGHEGARRRATGAR